nr:hypothetical protein [Bifidobacterium platyrrhinorum]
MVAPGRGEPALPRPKPRPDDVGEPHERAAADEQDAACVDRHGLELTMLARAFDGHRRDRPLQDLEQRLLHALAGHVARDGRVLAALARDLVDLVDVDDAVLGLRHVAVRRLDETLEHGLHVIAHIAGLGERGRVRDDERHVHDLRERLREIRLAHARRPHEQDVRFGDLDIGERIAPGTAERTGVHVAEPTRLFLELHVDALIVVVHRHGQRPLRVLLADHVLVEVGVDLHGLGQGERVDPGLLATFVGDDADAQLYAFVADGGPLAGDELADLMLGLAAERAGRHLVVVAHHTPHRILLDRSFP